MSMSPAGSESVPKVGSAEEEVSFGQEAEAAGGDGAFKPKEEAAGGDGTAKRPKSEEEAAGNGAAKRPKAVEEEAAIGAVKHPKPEEAAVVEGLKPEEAAVGDGPKPEEEEPPKVPRSISDEDFEEEYREEMDELRLLKKLLSGKKMTKSGQIKKVRVEGDAIDRLLKVRPRDMDMPKFQPLPDDFHLLPLDVRDACLSAREKALEMFEYEQYIIDQYDKKGYAEVHAYVFDK